MSEEHTPDAVAALRLLVNVRNAFRRPHYDDGIEQTCLQWMRQFIFAFGRQYLLNMGEAEVAAFLSHLARDRDVAAAPAHSPGAQRAP